MKRTISIILCMVLLVSIVPATKIKVNAATNGKTATDAINWVKAQVGKSIDYDGVYGHQCVDLTKAYYNYLGQSQPMGNGCDYATNALPSGWQRIKYTSGMIPQPGDIAIWTYASSDLGHVAIVISATSSNMQCVDQGSSYVTRNWTISYTYGTLYGFIRPDFSGGSTSSDTYATITEGTYYIKSTVNQNYQYLIVDENKDVNSQNISVWTYTAGVTGEQMTIKKNTDGYKILPGCSSTGKVVNVASSTVSDGINVTLYQDNNNATQWWKFVKVGSAYKIVSSANPSVCLTIDTDAHNVRVKTYTGAANQLWTLEPCTYRITYNLNGGSFDKPLDSMAEWDSASSVHIIQQVNPTITCLNGSYGTSNYGYFVVQRPTKPGYVFNGWDITGMDNCTHRYWDSDQKKDIDFTSSSITCKYKEYINLRSSDGLVTFTAKWESTHTHSYTSSVTTKATCTTDGLKTFTCSCGDSYTETIKATGHKNTVRITEKKATCLEKGSEDEYCLDCSELVGTYEIPALGHDISGEWVTEKSATCTEKGSKELYCKRCNIKIKTEEIPALGHNFVFVEKNENHPHNELFKCTRCRETKTTDSVYSATCPECNFTSTATDDGSCKITGYTGNLKKITIPATLNGKTVKSTNTGALKANTVITEVTIDDGVSEIGSLTFMNCTNLEKVIVPESVTTIGSMPFYGCADGFKVYCYRGSFAQEYCETNSIDYVIIDIAAQKGTEIDYENKLIFTQKENCLNILDLLKIPSTSIAVPTESFSAYIGSGSTVTVFENGDFTGDYKVIVYGDLDGDSVCDVFDIVMAERIFSKNATASKEQVYAANGCISEEIDIISYQNVVNSALSK